MHNSIGIITDSCERFCLELLSQAHSFPFWKGIFPKTAVTFYSRDVLNQEIVTF